MDDDIIYIDDNSPIEIGDSPIVIDDDEPGPLFPGNPAESHGANDGILMYNIKVHREDPDDAPGPPVTTQMHVNRYGHIMNWNQLAPWLRTKLTGPEREHEVAIRDEFEMEVIYRANDQFYRIRYRGYVPLVLFPDGDGDVMKITLLQNHNIFWPAGQLSMQEVFTEMSEQVASQAAVITLLP